MNEFKNKDNKIKILLNVSILREGIDIPDADMLVFIEAKFSHRLII